MAMINSEFFYAKINQNFNTLHEENSKTLHELKT